MTKLEIKIIEPKKEIKVEGKKHGVYSATSNNPNDRLLFYHEGILRLVINTRNVFNIDNSELRIQGNVDDTLYKNIRKMKKIKIEAELE